MSHPFRASSLQQAFFDWVATGSGSCVLTAVAGSGKSTTIVRSLVQIPEHLSVRILAFNSLIAAEMKAKIVALGQETGRAFSKVMASTFHSLGFGAVAKKLNCSAREIQTDGNKLRRLFQDTQAPEVVEGYGSFVVKLVSLAKGEGVGCLVADAPHVWAGIIAHHDMSLDCEDATEEEAIALARQLLKASNEVALSRRWIDFDDQLYLPVLWKLRLWGNDWLFIDEAQDTNPIRRAIAKMALRPGGRLVAVGDAHQAIYGFCHPAGTMVMTPKGATPIEDVVVGDDVIIANTTGDVSGWAGGKQVLETHRYDHSGMLVHLHVGNKRVSMTPHHKVPLKLDPETKFYTYMMRRCGVYRVGYCAALTTDRFMFSQRCVLEGADYGWLLGSFATRDDAIAAETRLLARVKGATMHAMNDEAVAGMDTDEVEALKILAEHGRMADFPLWKRGTRQHFEMTLPFVTEVCNAMPGMRATFYDAANARPGKRGRGSQAFQWLPLDVTFTPFNGPVYGITVPTMPDREGYTSYPLYFANDVLVHNTGASHDAIDLIRDEFNAIEMPLTVSYRCPKAVEALVQPLVPHFTVHEDAIEGEVLHLGPKTTLARLDSHDVVICRNTAPLITLAFRLIAQGRGCVVLGKEIGAGLIHLVKKQKARNVDFLVAKLEAYRDREVAAYMSKGEEQKAEAINDRVHCILTVIDNLDENNRTIPAVIARLESLFSDTNGVLTLCTAHKAKGREWKRVAVLDPELMPSKWARQAWQMGQEKNLQYVTWTRFQEELIFMDGVDPQPKAA